MVMLLVKMYYKLILARNINQLNQALQGEGDNVINHTSTTRFIKNQHSNPKLQEELGTT
jgi:hypothetical protein